MRPVRTTLLVALVAVVAIPTVAASQSADGVIRTQPAPSPRQADVPPARAPSWYFGVSALVLNTSDGTDRCPYICGPLSGWTVGAGVLAGGYLTRRVSVEAEVSTGTALDAPGSQRTSDYLSGGGRRFTARHRPTTVFLSGRVGVGRISHRGDSTVELLGGPALEVASQSQADGTDWVYQYGKPVLMVRSPDASRIETAIGVGGGLDIVHMLRDRLVLAAGGRVYWFARGQYDGSQIIGFPGPLTMQVRVGLRWIR
jgi:hypothetical protein